MHTFTTLTSKRLLVLKKKLISTPASSISFFLPMYVVVPFLFSSYIYIFVFGKLINVGLSLQLKFAGVWVD
jgi:hypothetical protein